MLKDTYPFYLANKPEAPNNDLDVLDKYTGEVAARVANAGPEHIETAIQACADATEPMRRLPSFVRKRILSHCVDRFRKRADELAMALCIEAGKPIKDSEGEVARLIDTFEVAAEESTRIGGEVMPMDISQRAEGYRGMTQRVPIGACSFITPFNFPLNLVAHKVAPAIACGCPFVLKPAEKTPIGALILGEVLAETELPPGAFSVLPCDVKHAGPFTTDQRLRLLSFTGSDKVGKMLLAQAGMKRVVLELGGNAACVVDRGVDLEDCVKRIIFGGYYQSGQSCVSVQRVIAHDDVYDELRSRLIEAVKGLRSGDPKDRDVSIGPLINEESAARVESWVREAADGGANILAHGARRGSMLEATLLEGVPRSAKLYREEAFGPVVILSRFSTFDDAIEEVNDSRYGLQAGVFTNDVRHMHDAWDRIEAGGVIINDVPSFRVDHMPYGGLKDSGIGREGIRSAIDDMTEVRLMVVRKV
ncbi:MAG: aldehyde dehydrogenase family protein [Phycisphaera sp.]|nr:MAG: aldehyde dehydrogenase family protein [Phycisphaera sp.]